MSRVAADMQLRTLTSFREIYTREVVTKARSHGLKVSHDFSTHKDTIPLPATMTKLIGDDVGDLGSSSKVFLYSKYPFPWNQDRGGLNDFFKKDAWEYLTKNPDKVFSREEKIGDKAYLRYAKADIMKESCIGCHNTHPESPKTDWKINDVRGVLEVYIPIDQIGSSIKSRGAKMKNTGKTGAYLFVALLLMAFFTFVRDVFKNK